MSFLWFDRKLRVSTTSTFNLEDYEELLYDVESVRDCRKTKYAPVGAVVSPAPAVMGAVSRRVLRLRQQLTNGLAPMEL